MTMDPVVVEAGSALLRGELADAAVADGAARMQHGDARRTHRARGRGPKTVRVGWTAKVDAPVAAQVTVSEDEATLYVATLGGDLIALARADGARRWTVKLGDRAYGAPFVHDDGTVWVGSDAKKMFAISAKGEVLHRVDVDGEADTAALATPDGNVVFAAGNQVLAVRRGGDVAWRFAAKSKVFTAPALSGTRIVFGSQDDAVYAVDAASGVLAWRAPLGADVDGAPVVGDDGSVWVGTDRNEVVMLAPDGGTVWAADAGGYVRGGLALARNGDVLAGTYGPAPRVLRIGPDGGIRGWFPVQGTGAREFGIHGAPLEDDDGALYFGAQDDAAYAIDPDGSVRWRFPTGADVDAPLTLLTDGSLVVPSEDGSVTLLLP
ncbi:MAG: PQQ-binding-like beta-propeller repeat protein [Labilithrix sp.]|nr:PQQ-binding-like beta-propeller repeat protein [Labilithrix sp.]MCW5809875.1 PQQ-binding-like beta-propeller repeat protein [Labilithrix sp.]